MQSSTIPTMTCCTVLLILCMASVQVNAYSREYMENYRRYYHYMTQVRADDQQRQSAYRQAAADGRRITNELHVDPDVDEQESRCRSQEYRRLTSSLQNEHQCIQLETIQQNMQNEKDDLLKTYQRIMKGLGGMENKLEQVTEYVAVTEALAALDINDFIQPKEVPIVRDCYTLGKKGFVDSGTYPIYTMEGLITLASCDMKMDGGGWTVIQRRISGRVNFTRTWAEYKQGFGNPNGDYWLGNEMVHKLTKHRKHVLRIDMWDWGDRHAYASYENFAIGSEKEKYKIMYGPYRGNGGDSFKAYHNNTPFSTPDRDNDFWYASCAAKERAGWWFRDCSYAALNGRYQSDGKIPIGPSGLEGGLLWFAWKGQYTYSLKKVEMKIRPLVGY